MAMIAGRLSTFAVDRAGGAAYTAVGKIVDATLNLSTDEVDVSNHDSSGNREFIDGFKDFTVDLSVNWDDADAGQEDMKLAYLNRDLFSGRFRLETAGGMDEYTFGNGAMVTSLTASGPNEDQATMDITVRITGALTRVTQ